MTCKGFREWPERVSANDILKVMSSASFAQDMELGETSWKDWYKHQKSCTTCGSTASVVPQLSVEFVCGACLDVAM